MIPRPPISTLFPYTTLFRSHRHYPNNRISPSTSPSYPPNNSSQSGCGISSSPTTSHQLPSYFQKNHNFGRSEEHSSELQSRLHLVCRLLLEKKKKKKT